MKILFLIGNGFDINENLWFDQTSFNLFDMIKEKLGIDSRYGPYPGF